MKASTQSLHAKLYKFTYLGNLPESLCPYFWKLVLATIIFIPNFILQLPAICMDKFDLTEENCHDRMGRGFAFYFIIIVAILFAVGNYNIVGYFAGNNFYPDMIPPAVVIDIIALAVLIVVGYHSIKDAYSIKYPYKEKHPSIIKEFVKAKYNKYCPKIEWMSNKLEDGRDLDSN